jgi:hypothetical protein
MGFRVVRKTKSPFKYSKSYRSKKKAEAAKKRLNGSKVEES